MLFADGAAVAETVTIDTGVLSGTTGRDPMVRVFKGIPYAAAPVGTLRWRPPQPVTPWTGVRKADRFSPMAMQQPQVEGSLTQRLFYPEPQPVSEDALYLNVWTAATSSEERRPVMVWLHGGGFVFGSASQPLYSGEGLAAKGAVVVTVNYRLGPFGFLAHPELSAESAHGVSGNYGLLDQIAALQWVQRNIAAFGGDPGKVTLFGQSAGAISTQFLMTSPLAKGLFHRAIAHSGTVFTMHAQARLKDAEAAGQRFVEAMGASSIDELRTLPAETLLEYPRRMPRDKNWASLIAVPVVDGWLSPDDVLSMFTTGKQQDIPLLLGSTRDEAASLPRAGASLAAHRSWLANTYGKDAARFEALYPARSDDEAWQARTDSMTDSMAWSAHVLARLHGESSTSPVFVYRFGRPWPGPENARYGAFHLSDVIYAFDNLAGAAHPWTATDEALADTMASYWVAFARDGKPAMADQPTWSPYRQHGDPVMHFADEQPQIAPWEISAEKRTLFDRQLTHTRGFRRLHNNR